MKRRTFLKALAGIAVAPLVPGITLPPAAKNELFAGTVGQWQGVSIIDLRAVTKRAVQEWSGREMEKAYVAALTTGEGFYVMQVHPSYVNDLRGRQ